jgi:hypothetical protein
MFRAKALRLELLPGVGKINVLVNYINFYAKNIEVIT